MPVTLDKTDPNVVSLRTLTVDGAQLVQLLIFIYLIKGRKGLADCLPQIKSSRI